MVWSVCWCVRERSVDKAGLKLASWRCCREKLPPSSSPVSRVEVEAEQLLAEAAASVSLCLQPQFDVRTGDIDTQQVFGQGGEGRALRARPLPGGLLFVMIRW